MTASVFGLVLPCSVLPVSGSGLVCLSPYLSHGRHVTPR